ncbi:hypothetical protein LCGC14_1048520 [marine sediment metagenome]|uniref:Uncharacterized protein n=1 Tax=marine sediment metagenome TaxID=412755 RepID=A0A0F9MPK3_9ZZZZ
MKNSIPDLDFSMSEKISRIEDNPEELTLAEKLIDDAKVSEAYELLNNFERFKLENYGDLKIFNQF